MKAFRGETNHRLDNLEQKVTEIKLDVSDLKAENKKEHQQLIQAIKELDTEVVKLKRVK
jgi:hypothetical protein